MRHTSFLLLFVVSACGHSQTHETRTAAPDGQELCRALIDDDRSALGEQLEPYLQGLAGLERDEQLVRFESWLSEQGCVESVERNPDLLDSEPPIQRFLLVTDDGVTRSIGVALAEDRLRFDSP